MNKVYLSLGSNLGDKKSNLIEAIKQIESEIGTIKSISSIYESEPWGFNSSNSFYNLALSVNTKLNETDLLYHCQNIEKNLGRKNKTINSYSDRILDIDILYFNNQITNFDNLQIPHLRIYDRQFVLQPMREIASDFIDPVKKISISEIQKRCTDSSQLKIIHKLDIRNIKLNGEQTH